MKRLASVLCLLSFSPPLFACEDLPVPITLSGTSFEDEQLTVATSGIRSANGRVFFDLKINQWCVEKPGQDTECGLKNLKFTATSGPDRGKIIGTFRFTGRQAYLYENKQPHQETDFEPNTAGPYFSFFEASASTFSVYGLDRLTTRAVDATGTLGQVSASRVRSNAPVKGIAPIRRIDLRRGESFFSNCGGLVSDAKVALAPLTNFAPPENQPPSSKELSDARSLASPQDLRRNF
jgi:hypothetical protein